MTRVTHVKRSRKDNPVVKKGEPYYWWKFRFGGIRYSATPPKPSQLTQSEFLSTFYSLQEHVADLTDGVGKLKTCADVEALVDALREVQSDLEGLHDDTEEKHDNVEESFPNGSPVLELLESRRDGCQETCDAVETAADDITGVKETRAEEEQERVNVSPTTAGKAAPPNLAEVLLTEKDRDEIDSSLNGICWEEGG